MNPPSVVIAFIGILTIGARVGWTMTSTQPTKPLTDPELDVTEKPKTAEST